MLKMKTKLFIPLIVALLWSAGSSVAQESGERWLTVEVRDASGRALERACVTFVPREGEIVFRKADKRGTVKLKSLLAGNYRVVVKVDGYEAQKREITIGDRSEVVAFALQPRNY